MRGGNRVATGTVRIGNGPFTQLDTDYAITGFEMERPCLESEPGSSGFALSSVRLWMNLGRSSGGESAGQVRLDRTAISSEVYTPAALILAAAASDSSIDTVRTSEGTLRQVKAPQVLADLVVLSSTSYEVRFYPLAQVGAQDAVTRVYAVSGTPFVTYLFDNPDTGQATRLRITETRGTASKISIFGYNSTTATWSLSTGGGLRNESQVQTADGSDKVKTTTVSNQTGVVATKVARTYRAFPWGEELIREVLDPAGAMLTTTYSYYDDVAPADPNYRRLKQRTDATGGWERFTYDSSGRILKRTRPFKNSAPDTVNESLCRVTQHAYDTIPDADSDSQVEARTTTIELTLGQETGRRYEIDWSKAVTLGGDVCRRRTNITCTVAGAAWNAATNLVTETLWYSSGTFANRTRRVVNADGTAVVITHALDAGGAFTTTTRTGQPNAAGDTIVDGRRTTTVIAANGQFQSEQLVDVASGLTLSMSSTLESDTLGRPTLIAYADGTSLARSYACCGLASERDRLGVTTTYTYDALGRRDTATRLGRGTKTTYDADGRVKSVIRIGTDSTEQTVETSAYDLAGRLTQKTDARSRATTYAELFEASTGQTTRTTTHPDGGTVVETSARDGSLLSVAGTAAAPRSFDYGVDATGVFTQTVLVGGTEAVPTATEWSKAYVDFAGRPFKTVFADSASAQSYFSADGKGQLIRQVDPDGVTTLFAYNARGEQETVAVDLNANGVIDYAGTDRITRTTRGVATRTGTGGPFTVERTTTQVWETDGADTPATTAVAEQTVLGLRSWQTIRGLETTTVVTLDGSGGRTEVTTTPDGAKTTRTFSGERLLSQTVHTAADIRVASTVYAHDIHGRVSTATDARNGVTTYTYFADDRLQTVTTPDPDAARTGAGFDPRVTTYAYETAGRVSEVAVAEGGVTTTTYRTYWPTGAVRRISGAGTYPVEYAYDRQGRLKTLTTWQDFAGSTGAAVTTWNYDAARGWLANKRYADSTGPTYTYKPSGRLLTRTWARTPAVTTTYAYNPAGDLASTDYSDATLDVALTYDRSGRPRTVTDGSGARTLSYHASGALEDEAFTAGLLNGITVDRGFDSLHRPSGVTVSGVVAATYAYDGASRLNGVAFGTHAAAYTYPPDSALIGTLTLSQGGTARLTATRTYDLLDRLVGIAATPSAGTAASYGYAHNRAGQRATVQREDGAYWSYGYDTLGQVTTAARYLAGGTAVPGHTAGWTYDDIGNRRTATANGQTSTYTASLLNQYTQRTVPGVVDVLGAAQAAATVTVAVDGGTPQATTRQGELFFRQVAVENAGAARQVALTVTGVKNLAGPAGEDAVTAMTRTAFVARTPESYGHDADGNLLADGRWTYTWDGENRLIGMETGTAAVAAGVARRKLEFLYDGQGRRWAKKVSHWTGSAWQLASHTLFLYDGWNLLAELNALGGNAAVRTYVWGLDLGGGLQTAGGVGGLLAATTAATGTTHFAYHDGNGNVGGLVRASDGTLRARYDYGAFGETLTADGPDAGAVPFRFSSKFADDDSGLLYYGFRYYNPATGRWPNRDPLGEEGGINLYAMVANDPVNSFDPFGLDRYTDRHPTGSCSPGKSCAQNYEILKNYLRAVILRLNEDFTPTFRDLAKRQASHPNPRYKDYTESWNGHVEQVWQMIAVSSKCLLILKAQLDSGKCCPPDQLQKNYEIAKGIWTRSRERAPGEIAPTQLEALENDINNSGGPVNWMIRRGIIGPPVGGPVPVPAF